MPKDNVYTCGVIAAKEAALLGGKISKLCEGGVDDAFRGICESGFGKGADASSAYEYEKLLAADERDTDGFIREYAPNCAQLSYLLSPRDFHNAKALFKARYLNVSADKMLAPFGLVEIALISQCIESGNFKPLGGELCAACERAAELFSDNEKIISGAEVGEIFEQALYKHLAKTCSKDRTLKKLVAKKADMTNILTAMRAPSAEVAQKNFVDGGKLQNAALEAIFIDEDKAVNAAESAHLDGFLKSCFEAKRQGLPYAQAELMRDNAEIDFLSERKYELKSGQPFLYYVLRRRAENANVRILFACLLAGMDENSVKKRLRAF